MNFTGTTVATQQLVDAIEADNLVTIHDLLSQETPGGEAAVSDMEIEEALCVASGCGNVDACELLCKRLSLTTKQRYSGAENSGLFSPLHEAVKNGKMHVVQFFLEDCDFFNVNQFFGPDLEKTPLCFAADSLKMTLFLLKNGADPNRCGRYGKLPLQYAVAQNNTEVTRVLLLKGNDPNLYCEPAAEASEEEDSHADIHYPRNTDTAMTNGKTEILHILLQHGAYVGGRRDLRKTTLSQMLQGDTVLLPGRIARRRTDHSRQVKLDICIVLVKHAKKDRATAVLLSKTLEICIMENHQESCKILLEAGVNATSRDMLLAIQYGQESTCRLLVQHGVDPFREGVENGSHE